jgi:pyridinium-3,5-biscarboxylic acid mononucleotide sulfurtransferase
MKLKMEEKLKNLEAILKKMPVAALAFSGGVDSSFLLAMLKKNNPHPLTVFTISSQFVPGMEIDSAKQFAQKFGVRHICLNVDMLENSDVILNSLERCYFCKKQIFSIISDSAKKYGINTLVHGINLDDLKDFRPGLRAAEELGFISPLVMAGFTKKNIREFSKEMGLETWNKPSQSCLATRIAYDEKITAQKLGIVDQAEIFLHQLKFVNVRVRCHGKTARIEVEPGQITRLLDNGVRKKISLKFSKLGFEKTSIDIDGYKTDDVY